MKPTCSHPKCDRPANSQCDRCGKPFCSDHGSIYFNFPSACYRCGGFNCWEGMTDAQIDAEEAKP